MSGKNSLTRPMLALLGKRAYKVGEQFAPGRFVNSQIMVWNNFSWPQRSIEWTELLNILNNEPFCAARLCYGLSVCLLNCEKMMGDCQWNAIIV
jgi:hypothetical protein